MIDCKCNLFQRIGTCWHTGYRGEKPTPKLTLKDRVEQRRSAFLNLLKETKGSYE